MPRPKLTALLTGLVVLALLAAGCGGDGSPQATGRDAIPQATPVPEDTAPADGTTGDPAIAGGGVEFCEAIAQVQEHFAKLKAGVGDTADQAVPPETFDQAMATLAALAALDAPEEIREAWTALLALLEEFARLWADLIGAVDPADPENQQAWTEEMERFEAEAERVTGELEAAGQRIVDYVREECGIDLDIDLDTDLAG